MRLLLMLAIAPILIGAIPIDNAVEGEPEIECSSDSITVNFNTRNEFQGHVYVKGRFNEPACRSDEKGRRVAGIKLSFSACGTKRERSLSPKGVFVSSTVVITFHPQFLTKVDRAYTIQCFYMEADKTVSQDLEVSEITTAFQTQTVPMPICRYDILDGGPTGQPVRFATIGQQVYHKWTCETETADIFCAIVHSCYVDDGAGNRVQLLTEKGCAIDKYLLNNLEYQSDLMAGHEAHVFKYADKPALVFQCQVTILIKEPNQPCPRPQCPEAGGPAPGNNPTGPLVEVRPAPPPATRLLLDAGFSTPPPQPSSSSKSGTVSLASSPRPSSPFPSSPTTPNTSASSSSSSSSSTSSPPSSINGTRRAIQIRRDFSSIAARLLRRARSVGGQNRLVARSESPIIDSLGTWDVSSQQITTLDIDAGLGGGDIVGQRLFAPSHNLGPSDSYSSPSGSYCLSAFSLAFMISVSAAAFVAGIVSSLLLCRFRRSACCSRK